MNNNIFEKRFKDKCEGCNKFEYVKGYQNKCLCEKCISNLKENKSQNLNLKKIKFKQLSIFELERL